MKAFIYQCRSKLNVPLVRKASLCNNFSWSKRIHVLGRTCKNKNFRWQHWLITVSILIFGGAVYRMSASRLDTVTDHPVILPISLNNFPVEIDGWVGRDLPIPEYIQRVAGNDDFLNRFFIHETTNQWANVYVAYSARPRTMLGHRPQVCYTAGGWVHERTIESEFVTSNRQIIPYRLHNFSKPGFVAKEDEKIVVLNFYILNGQVTNEENNFSGISWRTPNIAGDPAHYVAQVQISSSLESSARKAAKEMTGRILEFFPDRNGKINLSNPILAIDNFDKK